MELPFSPDERDALSRYVGKLLEDVERLAALYESRGRDSSLARSAQSNLQQLIDGLHAPDTFGVELTERLSVRI